MQLLDHSVATIAVFSWLMRWRRLCRDYERSTATAEAMMKWAMVGVMHAGCGDHRRKEHADRMTFPNTSLGIIPLTPVRAWGTVRFVDSKMKRRIPGTIAMSISSTLIIASTYTSERVAKVLILAAIIPLVVAVWFFGIANRST
jgi:hypothetical protein